MKKYKAVIVGAGSIGSTKPDDLDYQGSENILTMANACHRHERIDLIGIVDIDIDKAVQAAEKWNTKAYDDLKQIDGNIDIIVCAVPTKRHIFSLLEILKYKPKLVIAEKPFCNNLFEAELVSKEYERLKIPIALDYIRRFAPGINKLKKDIDDYKFGKIYYVRLNYTRGIFHEACHFIDLCRYLFGEFVAGNILDIGNDLKDNEPELTVSAFLAFEKCDRVFMCPSDGRDFCVFDIEIITSCGKIVLSENGTTYEFYDTEKSKYGDYQQLSKEKSVSESTELYQALYYVIDNVVSFLDGKEKLICTDRDGIGIHKIYRDLLN